MSNLELRHGIFADSDCLKEYVNRQKVDELEKIKTEIDDYAVIDGPNATKRGFEIMQGIVLEIVDNHISELKGENNAE